jgi:hypothetical protein
MKRALQFCSSLVLAAVLLSPAPATAQPARVYRFFEPTLGYAMSSGQYLQFSISGSRASGFREGLFRVGCLASNPNDTCQTVPKRAYYVTCTRFNCQAVGGRLCSGRPIPASACRTSTLCPNGRSAYLVLLPDGRLGDYMPAMADRPPWMYWTPIRWTRWESYVLHTVSGGEAPL